MTESARLVLSSHRHLQAARRLIADMRRELAWCATMDDVDAVIRQLSDDPGPLLRRVRAAELARRSADGVVIRARFG